jgi:hypothetical protein
VGGVSNILLQTCFQLKHVDAASMFVAIATNIVAIATIMYYIAAQPAAADDAGTSKNA